MGTRNPTLTNQPIDPQLRDKIGKNDHHARLPSVNKNLFDKGNWQALIAVQEPRCRRNNSANPPGPRRSTQKIHEAYGAQHSRPTRGMMFQDLMPTCGAGRSSPPRNVIIYNFPGCSAAEPSYKVQQQWTTTSCLLTTTGSPTEPHRRLRNGHPDVQGVQCPNMSFACTECFGPHNIKERIMVKKAVKHYCSNSLKNDYESEEIDSQDSEHEDKKSDNQYSECDDKEETYAYYNETL